MAHEALHKQITELHAALSQTDAVDAETQEALKGLEAHIQPLLNGEETDHETLRERLEEAMVRFEVEHLRLANHLRIVVGTLSNMGL